MAAKSGGGEESGPKSTRRRVGDGIRQGIGVLSAFKDALEETIQEARERGDLSADRAKEVMKGALAKAQTAASGARERLDFATQAELDGVQSAVEALKERVAALETRVFGEPEGEKEGTSEP
jgi:polyhydroxyalkanoate synthesis regulator phasin